MAGVLKDIGVVSAVPSWFSAMRETWYSIPGTTLMVVWVSDPSNWYTVVVFEASTVRVKVSAPESAV